MRWVLLVAAALLMASTAAALKPGDTPPPIGLPDLDGKEVDLHQLEGKVVLVDFWASWCGPCREEMPVLEALHKKYADEGLVIIGVNIDSSAKKMKNFLKGASVTFPHRPTIPRSKSPPGTSPPPCRAATSSEKTGSSDTSTKDFERRTRRR